MKDKEEILEYPDFSNVLKNFLNEIEALNETLPMVMALILLKDKQHNKRLDTFIKKSDLVLFFSPLNFTHDMTRLLLL